MIQSQEQEKNTFEFKNIWENMKAKQKQKAHSRSKVGLKYTNSFQNVPLNLYGPPNKLISSQINQSPIFVSNP